MTITTTQREAAARLADWLHASGVVNSEVKETIALLRELLAEPQSGPAAWMHDGFVSTNFERVKHDESRNLASGFKAKPIIPLYAHPPQQRKPLTEEQIMTIAFNQRFVDGNQYLIDVARAIEEAVWKNI